MPDSLFTQLKKIGIDEELAHQVSASLDPDHNASKKDVLIMQEAMLQLQARTDAQFKEFKQSSDEMQAKLDKRFYEMQAKSDERYFEMQAKSDKLYYELKTEMTQGFADVRSEMHSMHRQYWITFGGLITTIISVFAVNWYFH